MASRNATLSITNLTEPAAWIDVYYPVLNTPLDRSLEILGDDGHTAWKAELEEIGDELDSDAYTHADSVGAWHGLSKDGEAEGRLIFANYGRKRDYDELVEKGCFLSFSPDRLLSPLLTPIPRRRLHWCNCTRTIWWGFPWSEGKHSCGLGH